MPVYFSPKAIIFIRVFVSMLMFWGFHALFVKEKVERKDLLRLAFIAVWGIALNQIMFFEGLNLTTPINAAIIMTVNPVLVVVFSFFMINESISLKKIAGIVLGAAGAMVLILNLGSFSFSSATFTGNLFIFINASSFAVYLVLLKPLTGKYKVSTLSKWIFIFGFIYVAPICFKDLLNVNYSIIPFNIWMSLMYVIVFATFGGYMLYNFALTKISASTTSFFIYFQPLISTIVALVAGKDSLDSIKILSAMLIFSGVYFISQKSRKEDF